MMRASCRCFLPFVCGVVVSGGFFLSPASARAAAPECEDLTVDAMNGLLAEIDDAEDALPGGSEPEYVQARLAFDNATAEVNTMIAWMLANDPSETLYSEAAQLAGWLGRANVDLWAAATPASVGAGKYSSTGAKASFELAMNASETATDLRRSAGLCYIGGYLP